MSTKSYLQNIGQTISKESNGAKIGKKYDKPATQNQRVFANVGTVLATAKAELELENRALNPAWI